MDQHPRPHRQSRPVPHLRLQVGCELHGLVRRRRGDHAHGHNGRHAPVDVHAVQLPDRGAVGRAGRRHHPVPGGVPARLRPRLQPDRPGPDRQHRRLQPGRGWRSDRIGDTGPDRERHRSRCFGPAVAGARARQRAGPRDGQPEPRRLVQLHAQRRLCGFGQLLLRRLGRAQAIRPGQRQPDHHAGERRASRGSFHGHPGGGYDQGLHRLRLPVLRSSRQSGQ